MSGDDERRSRISDRIAASQARLDRGAVSQQRRALPDASPPDDYRSLALEYPWLTLAAAIGGGMLIGALLPRSFGRRLGRGALSAARVGGELALALGQQAREAGRDGLTHLGELGEAGAELRQRSVQASSAMAGRARKIGAAAAREAIKLAKRKR